MRARELSGRGFYISAVGLPLLLLGIHWGFGHRGDIAFFFEWHEVISASVAFYDTKVGVNYPIFGALFVSLPASLWSAVTGREIDLGQYFHLLKISLTGVEIGFILAAAAVATRLQIPRPRELAIGLYLVPATWAGGAWFGQIEILGSFWLLLALWGALVYVARQQLLALAVGCVALQAAILTKQLTLFSVPGLLLILGLAVSRTRDWRAIAIAASSFLLLFLPDLFLDLPAGYHSHLSWVLFGGGSTHGDVLSGNGANIWALIASDPSAPSTEPFLLGLSAKLLGGLLFAAVLALALGGLGREAWMAGEGERRALGLRSLILYVGICNLAMATLLTGVHERYLYYGVPFLLLGLAVRRRCPAWLKIGAWLICGWSGLFVLASIHWEDFVGPLLPFRSHLITGLLELALLAVLLVHLWRRPEEKG